METCARVERTPVFVADDILPLAGRARGGSSRVKLSGADSDSVAADRRRDRPTVTVGHDRCYHDHDHDRPSPRHGHWLLYDDSEHHARGHDCVGAGTFLE